MKNIAVSVDEDLYKQVRIVTAYLKVKHVKQL
jgi:hypothetical protein